ncbi:MAG: hypothetical protein U0414_28700 [Polyangiaceae bacterium]
MRHRDPRRTRGRNDRRSRAPRFGLCALLTAACLVVVLPAEAAPKDAQAEKAYGAAMNEDYLDSKFDEAQKKIDKALETCGDSGCAPKVKAKLYMAKGIILGVGKKKNDDAKAAFVEGLKLDPSASPDQDYMTSDLKAVFEDAQKIAKKSGGNTPGPSADGPMSSNSPTEQVVDTPVPIFVSLDDDMAKKVTSMSLSYTPSNESTSRRQKMEKAGKAFRGTIPCSATSKKGQVQYWITAKDKNDAVVGQLGSEDEPLTIEIKTKLDGDPPSWPGFAPPEKCAGSGPSPEDLRAKSSLRQCVDTADCPTNEKCTNSECLLQPEGATNDATNSPTPDPGTGAKKHRHWISVSFMPDLDVVSGDAVCSKAGRDNDHFVCLRQPGVGGASDFTNYTGSPTAGKGNNINSGIVVGQMRLMLGYDGVIADNFSLGARVGYAFLGSSSPANFFPAHLEARAAYAIGSTAYTTAVARPWFELFGGASQFDSAVDVQVLEDGEVCGASDPSDPASPCAADYGHAGGDDGNQRLQTLTAIKQAGLGFVGAGAGLSLMPAKFFAINIGFRFTATVPVFVPVLSPNIGIAFGP